MANDVLSVELEIKDGNAEVVIGKNRRVLEDFVKDVNKAEPKVKFSVAGESYIDLDKLEKRAAQTRKAFEDVAKVRLDGGQAGLLTKEIVRTSERAKALQLDISNIKRELANPNRKSSIAFLIDELKPAEREAEQLKRKLNSLPNADGRPSAPGRGNLKLSSFQKQNLAYQINDVATMAAMGANPLQILASQAGQIAQIFEPAQIAAFAAKYASLVSIMGAGAIAIGATYKITSEIRAEAERRLKLEETITGAINRQRLSQKEGLAELQKAREDAERSRQFSGFLQSGSVDELRGRRAALEQRISLTPRTLPVVENGKVVSKSNEDFERLAQEIAALDAQITQTGLNQQNAANDAFNQRWESYKKSQEDALKFEEAAARKREQDIEKAKEKVRDLGKTYTSVFDALSQKVGANNPFVSIFSEGEKSLNGLRENLRGLPQELQNAATALQSKLNDNALFSARLDNSLDALNLRDEAAALRNPANKPETEADRQKRIFNAYLSSPPQFNQNPAASIDAQNYQTAQNLLANNKISREEFDQIERRAMMRSADVDYFRRLTNVSTANPKGSTFNDLNAASFVTSEARRRSTKEGANENLTLQERLDRQLKAVDSQFADSPEKRALADRKLIALTNGLDSNALRADQIDKAAGAREREADRLSKAEDEARKERDADRKIREKLNEVLEKLAKTAEKGGIAAVNSALEITVKDDTAGGVKSAMKPAATAADTAKAYKGGTFFDEYENQ